MSRQGPEIQGENLDPENVAIDRELLQELIETDDPRQIQLRAEQLRLAMIEQGVEPREQTMWEKIKSNKVLRVGGTAALGALGGFALGQIPGAGGGALAGAGLLGSVATSPFGYVVGGAGLAAGGMLLADHKLNAKPKKLTYRDQRRIREIRGRIARMEAPRPKPKAAATPAAEETPAAPQQPKLGQSGETGTYSLQPLPEENEPGANRVKGKKRNKRNKNRGRGRGMPPPGFDPQAN